MTDPKFQSLLNLSSNNSRYKASTSKKYQIFGNLRTWPFTWSYTGKKFPFQKCRREGNLAKNAGFGHFSCPHRKIFKWLPIGQRGGGSPRCILGQTRLRLLIRFPIGQNTSSTFPLQVLDPSGGDFDLMSCDILVCRWSTLFLTPRYQRNTVANHLLW